jgi:membrane fusion protein, multidrug efflux system
MATKTPAILETSEAEKAPQPPREPRKTGRRVVGWLIVLVLGGLGYGAFRSYQAAQQKQRTADAAQAARQAHRAVPVAAVPVRTGDMPVYLRGLGSVVGYNTVTVKSRVDGQLIAVHFREGQFVHKGDLLAEIDPRPFQAQLEQAQGALARDQAQLNNANTDLARYRSLWQRGIIAKQQYDTQSASVGQYEGTLQADEAAINSARLQLTYARITAPIAGRMGLRMVDAGNIVHASDANGLAVITQMQPIAVLFTIPADNLPPVLGKLRAGARLQVEAYDRADREKIATGSLLTVDNQIDATTGTSRLKAVFSNSDGALFPNQFVNCRLLLDQKRGAILVAAAAIQRGPQGAYVYVIKPDKTTEMRKVAPGISEGSDVVIDTGLAAGELVVVDGQDKLQEGSRVQVRTQPGTPARRRPGA